MRDKRVLITGAARGLGALTAKRLHERGARVGLIGLEPELLEQVAKDCGDAPWAACDVSDREQVDTAVNQIVDALGGLDVVVANAGIAAQAPLIGGNARVFEKTIEVNTLGTYYTIRAAGPHVSHENGYVLLTASLAAVVHLPLMSAYCASKAAVRAFGNSLRHELLHTGAKVGIAYYAELDTDMTTRGFSTQAAKRMPLGGNGHLPVGPVGPAIDAIERGIEKRAKRIVSPWWVRYALHIPGIIVQVLGLQVKRKLPKTLEIARQENPDLTTPQ